MSEQLFWAHLSDLGGLQNVWWYTGLTTPALLVAVFALFTTTLAIRQNEGKLSMFFLLLLACIPLLFIVPSFYVTTQPRGALSFIGMEWPADTNQFPRQAAQTLGLYLNFLAQIGITGLVIAVIIALGGLTATASSMNVPVISTTAKQITQVVRDKTQRFRRNKDDSASLSRLDQASCPYGRLEVLTGIHAGNQFAIRPGNTLGRKECDIVITDSATSRLHARFDVDDHLQTTITDQQSANGLFVYRIDMSGVEQKYDIGAMEGRSFALYSSDVITIGDPDHEDDGQFTVKIRFDREHF